MKLIPWLMIAYALLMIALGNLWANWKEQDAPQYKKGFQRRRRR